MSFNNVSREVAKIEDSLKRSSELVAIAEFDGVPAGFACAQAHQSFCYDGSEAEITEMFVEEEFRRNGIASRLIEFLEDGLQQQGVQSIKILTGHKNQTAVMTYEAAGYVQEQHLVLAKTLFQDKRN
ncbi:GNAT family N-acetyltransferase [Paenibacillus sp. CAA11]|uniref:GNAT family N-acetyltransferase n=1 Tax=Paenibacillus sp. CAA11 TaxID=1532905 RepID=UPI000D353BAB|nr:GNAT family N-acetyltransferase [Paenibacillus sp. CAA11]AWB46885.1 GNAT family N-acetyltransferase [Paenibacillus sp. CAA11]